jgi:hypothetical protein
MNPKKHKECALTSLTSLEFRKLTHSSTSIILFAMDKNRQQVVVKLAPALNNDNSLELERQFYMLMKNMKLYSPHFASGLKNGVCDLEVLFKSHTNRRWNKGSDFHEAWKKLCLRIYSKENYMVEGKSYASQHPNDDNDAFFNYLMQQHVCDKAYFVITAKMQGKPLKKFLKWDYPSLNEVDQDRFDLTIGVEVAQALCAAKILRFIHNDLHLANIFIERFEDAIEIPYTVPFSFRLFTKYKITIFDYDLSFRENYFGSNTRLIQEGFCKRYGICNEYKEWFDWDTFLNYYIARVEPYRISRTKSVLRDIRGGEIGEYDPIKAEKAGDRAYFGRACTCDDDDCKTCTPEAAMKIKYTPCDFLETYAPNRD